MSARNLSDFTGSEIPSAGNFRFGILVSRWNTQITGALYEGAVNFLLANGAKATNIFYYEVPGSFELPSAAHMLLQGKPGLDAVICLGCVIQGETRHFDFICTAVAQGIIQVAVNHNKPVIFGVLTTNDIQQAAERAGGKHGNKGAEAAATAIQMAALQQAIH